MFCRFQYYMINDSPALVSPGKVDASAETNLKWKLLVSSVWSCNMVVQDEKQMKM